MDQIMQISNKADNEFYKKFEKLIEKIVNENN